MNFASIFSLHAISVPSACGLVCFIFAHSMATICEPLEIFWLLFILTKDLLTHEFYAELSALNWWFYCMHSVESIWNHVSKMAKFQCGPFPSNWTKTTFQHDFPEVFSHWALYLQCKRRCVNQCEQVLYAYQKFKRWRTRKFMNRSKQLTFASVDNTHCCDWVTWRIVWGHQHAPLLQLELVAHTGF